MAKKIVAKLAPKEFKAEPSEASKLQAALVEAQVVDSFVEGRKQVNEGNRKVNSGKRFFATAKKKTFIGNTARVIVEDAERMAFDKDAFIRDFGLEIYNKYYRSVPSVEYKVEAL